MNAAMEKERPPRTRKKVSAACTSCRVRRTKCQIGPGLEKCNYCLRNELECVIPDDDERKRPNSKIYLDTLNDRMQNLEQMIKSIASRLPDQPQDPSPQSPPQTGIQPRASADIAPPTPSQHRTSSPRDQSESRPIDLTNPISSSETDVQCAPAPSPYPSPSSVISESINRPVVDHFLTTVDGLRPTRASTSERERVRAILDSSSQPWEQMRRTERILRDVAPATDSYLLDMFFKHGNSSIPMVHREAFYRDKEIGGKRAYSGFLHICILAMGFRFANMERPDIAKLALPNRESTLHREAKYLVEFELENPGGVPSVQALLLLGDLECACGRDNTGWMYGGMATRLCFEAGLTVPAKAPRCSPAELENRRMALWACVIHDKYWSFFLGRPTSIKSSDLAVSRDSNPPSNEDELIFDALLELMDLVTTIVEIVRRDAEPTEDCAYLIMASFHRRLKTWYNNLPEALKWTPSRIQTAPLGYFLLHQQYHSSLILLHRPFANYRNIDLDDSVDKTMGHLALISRTICFDNAIQVARIFKVHQERHNIKHIYFSAVQHAGTAATALISGITLIKDPTQRVEPLQHLQCLAQALRDMSPIYQPAQKMSSVLSNLLSSSGWRTDTPTMRKRPLPMDTSPVGTQAKRQNQAVPSLSLGHDFSFPVGFRSCFEDVAPYHQHSEYVDSGVQDANARLQSGGSHMMPNLALNHRNEAQDLDWNSIGDSRIEDLERPDFLYMSTGFDELFNGT